MHGNSFQCPCINITGEPYFLNILKMFGYRGTETSQSCNRGNVAARVKNGRAIKKLGSLL